MAAGAQSAAWEPDAKRRRVETTEDQGRRELSATVTISARGERLVTSRQTLCGLPGFLATWLESSSEAQEPELFVDHDTSDVRALLNVLAAGRRDIGEALGIVADVLRRDLGGFRALMDFVGLGWAVSSHFPARAGGVRFFCGEAGAHHKDPDPDLDPDLGLGMVQDLVDNGVARFWHELPQVALIDELREMYATANECQIWEHGGYVPMGDLVDNFRQVAHQRLKIVFDAGPRNAIQATEVGIRLIRPRPDDVRGGGRLSYFGERCCLTIEASSEFSDELTLLARCRFDSSRAEVEKKFLVMAPIPQHRRHFCRMLRLSVDAPFGCDGFEVYGDFVQGIPQVLIPSPRPAGFFTAAYDNYRRWQPSQFGGQLEEFFKTCLCFSWE